MSHWELSKKIFKRYGKNGIFMLLLQAISVGIQLIVLPFFARVIPQAEFGILQFSQSLITWLSIFSVGHSTLGAKRGLTSGKDGTMWYVYLYRLRFMLGLFVLCLAMSLTLWLMGKPFLPEVGIIVGLFLLFGYLPQVSFPQIFIAKNNFGLFVLWQGLGLVVSQSLALLTAFLTRDILLIMSVQYGSFALLCIFGFVHALKRYHIIESYKRGEIDHESLVYGKKLIPVEIVQGTAGTLQNFIIAPLFGFANFAVFSVASRMDALFRSLATSGYYLLYRDFATTDLVLIKSHFKQKFFFLFTGSVGISVILFLMSVLYIQNFLSSSYHGAIAYIAILVCALPAVFFQSLIQSILESRLEANKFRLATYVSQGIRIVCLVCGTFFGILGISISLTVATWIGFLCFFIILFVPQRVKNIFYKK